MDLKVSLFARGSRKPGVSPATILLFLCILHTPIECILAADSERVRFAIDVRGKLTFNPSGKKVESQKMRAYGEITYDQVLHNNFTARHYRAAEAVTIVGETTSRRELRPNRRTLGVASGPGGLRWRAAAGPLTQEELDIVQTQFDPLLVQPRTGYEHDGQH